MSLRGGGYCGFNDSKYDRWLSRLENKIDRIVTALAALTTQGTKIMALSDDLKAAIQSVSDSVTALTTSVTDDVAEIETLLAKILSSGGSVSDADVQTAIAQAQGLAAGIKTQASNIDAEVAKARAASP